MIVICSKYKKCQKIHNKMRNDFGMIVPCDHVKNHKFNSMYCDVFYCDTIKEEVECINIRKEKLKKLGAPPDAHIQHPSEQLVTGLKK